MGFLVGWFFQNIKALHLTDCLLGRQVVSLPGESELNWPPTGNLLIFFPGNSPERCSAWSCTLVSFLKVLSFFFPLVVPAFHFVVQYTPSGSRTAHTCPTLCLYKWTLPFASPLFWRTPTYASRLTKEPFPSSLPSARQSFHSLLFLPTASFTNHPTLHTCCLKECFLFHLCYTSAAQCLVQSR